MYSLFVNRVRWRRFRPSPGCVNSLLFAAILLSGCGAAQAPKKPELPQSVSPGWSLKSYAQTQSPADLPGKPGACWKAEYAGKGSAQVLICGYGAGGAFDAAQRARAEANTVKFQEGDYLVIASWNGAAREEIRALVSAIQKSVPKS